MSKATVLSTVGVISAGASVTGAYMLGAFEDAAYLAKDLAEFKKSWGGTCTKRLFSGLKLEGGTKIVDNSNKVHSSSFNDGQEVDSCLIVNWERDNYTVGNDEKWMGNFRGSWSFKKGNKGFVMFTLAEAKGSEQKLDLAGGFYYVSRTSENDPWSVEKYDELETQGGSAKKIPQSDFSTKFPSVGDGFESVDNSNLKTQYPHGGFLPASETDLSKLCQSSGSCAPKNPKSKDGFRGYGTGKKESSNYDLSKGSTNFDGGLSNMYDKTSKLDLSNLFTTIKGKGKQASLKTSVEKK